jgi:nucleotide-binding universal stress UspA family protein
MSDRIAGGYRTAGSTFHTVGAVPTSDEEDVAIERIVVGVDGSPPATAAVRWAAREAALRNVELIVVHVVYAAVRRRPGEKILNDALAVIAKTTGPNQPRGVAPNLCFGAVVPTLREFAKGTGQMMVVGRRGRGGMYRALLGSVSSAVLPAARCPVAVVHHRVAQARPGGAPVVVGIDRAAAASVRATAIAFDEASRRATHVVVVHAIDHPDTAQADELLARSLAAYRQRYPNVGVRHVITCAHPADAVLDESQRAQLVIVDSHGGSGLAGKSLGSVSAAVVQACRVPVIVAAPARSC